MVTLIDVIVWITILSLGTFIGGIDPAWIALVGTLFGGAGLKLVEYYLGKKQAKADTNAAFARDYRAEIKELTDRVNEAEAAEYKWREGYYELREEISDLRGKQAGSKPPDVVK